MWGLEDRVHFNRTCNPQKRLLHTDEALNTWMTGVFHSTRPELSPSPTDTELKKIPRVNFL